MLTRRQKNSLRGFTAAMTSIVLLSAFLIYTNISNAEKTEPVVISDILEGAFAYSGDDEAPPAVTLAAEELMETMYSEQYESFTLPYDPALTVTYVSPAAAYPEDTHLYTFEIPVYADDSADTTELADTAEVYPDTMPENPNEITLLSDELNDMTTPSETTSVSVTSLYESENTTVSSVPAATTTYITYSGTTTATHQAITAADTTTAKTTATTTAKTTAKKTTAATTVPKTTSHTSKTPFTNIGGGTFSTDDSVYLTMLKLVNEARRSAGLNELWYSARVHDVCEIRANELTSYYSHNRPDGSRFSTAFKEIGINYAKCGENIAYGRNMFSTVEEVFRAWMDSESHRENILSPDFECCAFGLSVLKVGNDTYYYWAQEFAKF